MSSRMFVAGNWKMNGSGDQLAEIAAISDAAGSSTVDVALCLPATLIARACERAPGLAIGGQDVHHAERGAHTGCVSADMLLDAGARLTIVGHSERRVDQHEDDALVRAKAEAALRAGLDVILCVGEADPVRSAGQAVAHVTGQLGASLPKELADPDRFAIAYEPIWAIGTGKVAGVEDIREMHSAIRGRLRETYGEAGDRVRILYGGSVKADNSAAIFAVEDVDGALVGGASLKGADFVPIVRAAEAR